MILDCLEFAKVHYSVAQAAGRELLHVSVKRFRLRQHATQFKLLNIYSIPSLC